MLAEKLRIQDVSAQKDSENRRRVLFIPGVTTSDARVKGIKNALMHEYGEVMAINSLVSTDQKNPHRWRQMADFIMGSAKDGIDIVAYSLGAGELYKVFRYIEKKDKDFFKKQDKEKFHVTFIDPSGFNKGIKQKITYGRNVVRLVREHAAFPLISKKRTLPRGVDSLIAFPPKDFSETDLQKLSRRVREAFPGATTKEEQAGFKKIAFHPDRDNEAYKAKYLSSEQQKKLALYDQWLKAALDENKPNIVRHLLLERGELLKGAIDKVYEYGFEEPTSLQERGRMKWGGFTGFKMFFTALGRRPMGKFKQLANMGYSMDFLSLENSVAVPLKHVLQFFDSKDKAQQYIKIPEFFTHPGIMLQPESTAKIVRSIKAGGKK